jgi:uncharacterized glyoxalase superfamily protein PhnB
VFPFHHYHSTSHEALAVVGGAATLERIAAVGYDPEDAEWGTRRARISDLGGHEWSLGTCQPGQRW